MNYQRLESAKQTVPTSQIDRWIAESNAESRGRGGQCVGGLVGPAEPLSNSREI